MDFSLKIRYLLEIYFTLSQFFLGYVFALIDEGKFDKDLPKISRLKKKVVAVFLSFFWIFFVGLFVREEKNETK
jgi:hypothetical protein